MRATVSNQIGADPPVTTSVTSGFATAPPRHTPGDCDAANADHFRSRLGRVVEAAAAGIGRTIVGVRQRLRDKLERRRTLRELRRLGRSRLADIGIEPNDIERVVDGMIAARRDRTADGAWRRTGRSG